MFLENIFDQEKADTDDQTDQEKHVGDVQETGFAGDDPAQEIEIDAQVLVDQIVGGQHFFHIMEVVFDRHLPVVGEGELYGALHDQKFFQMKIGAGGENSKADGGQGEDQEDDEGDVVAEVHCSAGLPEVERSGEKTEDAGDQQGVDTDDEVGFAVHNADQGDLPADGDPEKGLLASAFGKFSW